MPLGHGSIAEFAVASVRGGGVQTLSTGSPNFFIWSEVDDSQTVTWTDVEPGSTD
jgi:hypothetical protein